MAGHVTDMQTPSPEHPAPHPWVPSRSPLCPTARSLPVGDAALDTFEQRVQAANLTEDHIWFFPKYGKSPPWLWWPARPPGVPIPAALTPAWARRFL